MISLVVSLSPLSQTYVCMWHGVCCVHLFSSIRPRLCISTGLSLSSAALGVALKRAVWGVKSELKEKRREVNKWTCNFFYLNLPIVKSIMTLPLVGRRIHTVLWYGCMIEIKRYCNEVMLPFNSTNLPAFSRLNRRWRTPVTLPVHFT